MQQTAIKKMERTPAHGFDQSRLSVETRAKIVPKIVVLSHPVVKPNNLVRMTHSVGRESEAYNLIYWTTIASHLDIG
jgi:hypothetical protein